MKKSVSKLLMLSVATIPLQACNENKGNMVYCSGEDHQMQFELPVDTSHANSEGKLPTILFIPGNGVAGISTGRIHIAGMRADMDAAKKRGFAVAAINYIKISDLVSKIDDAACAVRYLKSINSVDPDRIGVMGHSMGAMPAWAIAAGVYPTDILNDPNAGNVVAKINNSTDYSKNDDGSERNSLVAAVVVSNSFSDHLSAASKDQFRFAPEPEKTRLQESKLSCDSKSDNYYKWVHSNPFGTDYEMVQNLTGFYMLECKNGEVVPRDGSVNVDSLNIANILKNAPEERRTRGQFAIPTLIINGAQDDMVPAWNSEVTQAHFNAPELERAHTPLVRLRNAPHAYEKYNDKFINIYLKFFEKTIMDGMPHSDINYCEGIGFQSGEQQAECEVM